MSVRVDVNCWDVVPSLISREGFEQLYFQNPEFGSCLVRLIAMRFQHNLSVTARAGSNRERELRREPEKGEFNV